MVDGADLMIWQRQVGSFPAAVAATAAVPEPAGFLLSLLGAAIALGSRGATLRR
jgi:hypothetical protein